MCVKNGWEKFSVFSLKLFFCFKLPITSFITQYVLTEKNKKKKSEANNTRDKWQTSLALATTTTAVTTSFLNSRPNPSHSLALT